MRFSFIKEKLLLFWDIIKSFLIKILSSRLFILGAVFALLFIILFVRLFYLQIIRSDYYVENFTQKAQKTITHEGPRGNIYDCNGNLLAHNEICYSVTMTDEIPSGKNKGTIINGIVYNTIKLIEANGDKIISDFNIEVNQFGEYAFVADPVTRQITFLCNVFGKTSDVIYEQGYDKKTPDEIMEYFCDHYGIDTEKYSKTDIIKIATVRYALSLNSYQKYVSTVISNDISEQTKAAILESTDDLTGVSISESYKRVYDDAIYFAPLIGYTGQISEDELAEYNLYNPAGIKYESSDIVGKTGLEKSYDSYLQGSKGFETVFVDSKGSILEVIDEEKSSSGNNLYLTIDRDLQIAAYTILEKKLAAALVNKIVNYDYVAKEKQTYVYIPVKDVYYKLLTNVIDVTKFNRTTASQREKDTLSIYELKEKEIIENLHNELTTLYPAAVNDLSEEYYEYMYYIYKLLGNEGILDKTVMDTSDSVYKEWSNGFISLREFIQHAISENWIKVNIIDSEAKYANSDEIYNAVVEKAVSLLHDNREFSKLIYYYMVYNVEIDPYTICLMLYDQGKLEQDEAYEKLMNGYYGTYGYVIDQISNLVITPAMLALDPCSGALAITDINTGKLKALVTYPSYDNNRLSGSIDSEYWYQLSMDDSQPLFNRATQALTAPGSTFKLCTAVAALGEDYTTTDRTIYDAVYFEAVSPSPKCYVAPASHGSVDVAHALCHSCNYYFFQLGYEMGSDSGTYISAEALDIIEDYAIKLGLGIKSGVEIEETAPRVSTTDSVRTAIGQGTNGYATVHMARYVNTVANGGKNYSLSLVDRVENSNGDILLKVEPELTNTVELTQDEWDAIHYGMRLVVTEGTAKSFFTSLGVTVAGKTGTAEEDLRRSNHAAFVGYAPYENPEVSFACMIRNSDSTSYPGGVLNDTLKYYFGELTLEDVMNAEAVNEIQGFHSE